MKIWDTTTFWGRVKEKADKKGIYLKDLAEQCGIPQSTLFNQINLNIVPKKAGAIGTMAAILGTTVEYLLDGVESEKSQGLTEDERRCLFYFQSMKEENRRLLLELMKRMALN